ncbi:NADH dehydrogenase [ubiquinone] 1 alpha subcomplex subunit 4 [Habropoda laboriosa]|uniref:NADH dehydrogenase [ubiquinone] 1 alpha subcomplex subunit 4 n=1 Tax=Habropoda laboriosa TaxID=597456 RepID=A0A0L7RDZ4_9HYME|nr:PREDICTED: cytochrome c oxidase subunit NDUFA4 [Habropoda laboriosa]KOC68951.1 NADH dehydrogenase [ubiquinone] 1 alpha subcomplex subunit 4 [Habropoda laboriosa]
MIRDKMSGLTWATLKKNSMLLPLFFCIGMGALGSSCYLLRLAFRSPDVTWSTKSNPEPWNDYSNKDYKFITIQDTSKFRAEPPKY